MNFQPSLVILFIWSLISITLSIAARKILLRIAPRVLWSDSRNYKVQSRRIKQVDPNGATDENAGIMAHNLMGSLSPASVLLAFMLTLFAAGFVFGGLFIPSLITGPESETFLHSILLWISGAAWGFMLTPLVGYGLALFIVVVIGSTSLYYTNKTYFYDPELLILDHFKANGSVRLNYKMNSCRVESALLRSNEDCYDFAANKKLLDEFPEKLESKFWCKGLPLGFSFQAEINAGGYFNPSGSLSVHPTSKKDYKFLNELKIGNGLFDPSNAYLSTGYYKGDNYSSGIYLDREKKSIEFKGKLEFENSKNPTKSLHFIVQYPNSVQGKNTSGFVEFYSPDCGKHSIELAPRS